MCSVLIWRKCQNKWTCPYKLLANRDENRTVELPNGSKFFRTTIVRPFFEKNITNNEIHQPAANQAPNLSEISNQNSNHTSRRNPGRNRRLPGRYTMPDIEIHLLEPYFKQSRLVELNGLLERGVFKILS